MAYPDGTSTVRFYFPVTEGLPSSAYDFVYYGVNYNDAFWSGPSQPSTSYGMAGFVSYRGSFGFTVVEAAGRENSVGSSEGQNPDTGWWYLEIPFVPLDQSGNPEPVDLENLPALPVAARATAYDIVGASIGIWVGGEYVELGYADNESPWPAVMNILLQYEPPQEECPPKRWQNFFATEEVVICGEEDTGQFLVPAIPSLAAIADSSPPILVAASASPPGGSSIFLGASNFTSDPPWLLSVPGHSESKMGISGAARTNGEDWDYLSSTLPVKYVQALPGVDALVFGTWNGGEDGQFDNGYVTGASMFPTRVTTATQQTINDVMATLGSSFPPKISMLLFEVVVICSLDGGSLRGKRATGVIPLAFGIEVSGQKILVPYRPELSEEQELLQGVVGFAGYLDDTGIEAFVGGPSIDWASGDYQEVASVVQGGSPLPAQLPSGANGLISVRPLAIGYSELSGSPSEYLGSFVPIMPASMDDVGLAVSGISVLPLT